MVAGGLIAVGLRLVRLGRKVAAPLALREPIEIINACEAHDVDKAEVHISAKRRSGRWAFSDGGSRHGLKMVDRRTNDVTS